MTRKGKYNVAATVAIVAGFACIALGYGPLAYEPTIMLSFAVYLLGGVLAAFGIGFVLSSTSIKSAVTIGVCGSLAAALVVGCHIMSNANRARRVLAALGVDYHPGQEVRNGK